MTDRVSLRMEAQQNIGQLCWWLDEPQIVGRIIGVKPSRNGWTNYLVGWPSNAPDWWSDTVSASSKSFRIAPRQDPGR